VNEVNTYKCELRPVNLHQFDDTNQFNEIISDHITEQPLYKNSILFDNIPQVRVLKFREQKGFKTFFCLIRSKH
jgi:hypothetical protein